MHAEGIAFREVGRMVEHDAVALAIHVAAPVLVAMPLVGPVVLVAVVVHVPRVVHLDLARAEVLKVPADGLSERKAVLGAAVGVSRSAE